MFNWRDWVWCVSSSTAVPEEVALVVLLVEELLRLFGFRTKEKVHELTACWLLVDTGGWSFVLLGKAVFMGLVSKTEDGFGSFWSMVTKPVVV